jgi:hypothetical protein
VERGHALEVLHLKPRRSGGLLYLRL